MKHLLQRGATGENLLTILHYVNEKLVGSLKKSEGEKLISGVCERVSGNARKSEDQFQIVLGEEAALYVSACCCLGTESGTVRVSVIDGVFFLCAFQKTSFEAKGGKYLGEILPV